MFIILDVPMGVYCGVHTSLAGWSSHDFNKSLRPHSQDVTISSFTFMYLILYIILI